jgi:NAD+ synthase (glutamine-hydrolysing)
MEKSFERKIKVATCTLNQWAMDFTGNKQRIIDSLRICQENNVSIRIGPELEVTGYNCEDHFYEMDTIIHSWEVLASVISSGYTTNMLCDIGMPVEHNGVFYNCRVLVFDSKIILIRPKIAMADDGNYRESRWFTPWKKGYVLEDFIVPSYVQKNLNQDKTKIGVGVIRFLDCSYAPEICEEMWMPFSPSYDFCVKGVEIIGNSSGSHFQTNKQERRYEIVLNSSKKNGGVFLFSNLIGCDGGRLYFDGGSFITLNGNIINEGKRFMLQELEVITAVVDLNEISSYRNSIKSRCMQATEHTNEIPSFIIESSLTNSVDFRFNPFEFITPKKYTENEELGLGPPCWLWDFLRRSGASGYFIPLSGGADSSCVTTMVGLLTRLIFNEIQKEKRLLAQIDNDDREEKEEKDSEEKIGNNNITNCLLEKKEKLSKNSVNNNFNNNKHTSFVLNELRKIVKDSAFDPKSPKEICNILLVSCFMGSPYSSEITRANAQSLSEELGSCHINFEISEIVGALKNCFIKTFKKEPKFISEGGSSVEDLALQNIQSRTRMCISYLIAGLVNWTRERNGFLLVLGSANLDEGIMGYMTKYDCSSADLNPIGSLSKNSIKSFLLHCNKELGIQALEGVLNIEPSAELRPQIGNKIQSDEEDMGITYEELSIMGRLRKDYRSGPVSMFSRLTTIWQNRSKKEIYEKVKIFFKSYAVNRHKMTTITPALHCQSYSLDDNRYDLRQFLYNTGWSYQFNKIDSILSGNNPNIIRI